MSKDNWRDFLSGLKFQKATAGVWKKINGQWERINLETNYGILFDKPVKNGKLDLNKEV